MAPRFLLDTNICIYIRSHRPAHIRARFARLSPGEAALSVITYGELLFGAEKSANRAEAMRRVQELAGAIPILALADDTGIAYGAIRAHLEARGEMIGNNDLWIAAHARAAKLVLVTNNLREFRRVPDLKVENWV